MAQSRKVALITGASSGIGEAFARALAARGESLVLVARRTERLEMIAAELASKYNVSVTPITADLSQSESFDQVYLARDRLGVQVETLVNNAGFGLLGSFDEVDFLRTTQMVDLNCRAVVALTHKFLPGMKERGRGNIIIVSSVVGTLPAPWFATYAASKAFDLYFGEALYGECQDTGVSVVTVLPGLTKTEFQASSGLREYHSPYRSAEQVVSSALSALGRRAIVVDGMLNKVLVHGTRFLPRCLLLPLSRMVMKYECRR
jgi:short-subunit dehydrogenase